MAILTYPLNGILYDAEDAEIYNCTRTSGVFASDGHFPASVTGTREVSIGPGLAWMQNEEFHGKAVYNPETVALTIAEADAYQARIDRIVLRFDKLMNQTTLEVIQGTPSSSPVAPDITRDAYTYELGLYTVNVKASSISVSTSDVGNTFLDDSVCGIMADAVTNIPTQELYDQWYAWFATMQVDTETLENQFNIWFENIREEADAYMTEVQYDFQVWMNGEKVSFDEWFDTVQDTLDSDTAGKLTNLVNDAQDTADEALEQLATGFVRGFMTDEAEGGEYALLADDSDETHGITLMRPICNCEEDASKDLISDEFQSNYTYSEGDYCIYEDTLYVFTADKSAGEWDWNCVKATNVSTELKANAESVVDLQAVKSVSVTYDSTYWTDCTMRVYQSGNIVTFYCTGTFNFSALPSTNTWSTVMSGFPAPVDRLGVAIGIFGSSNAHGILAQIASSGNVQINKYAASSYESSVWIQLFGTYIVSESSTTASPQSIPDDGDTKTAPGPEIIDPDDDDTKTAPGPEIVDPDDDENPDDGNENTGTLEPGEVIPDDDEPDDDDGTIVGPEEVE